MTQKLNWNDTVMFPYNLFRWLSPDGSEVLAYQTVGGYWGNPKEVEKIASYFMMLHVRQGLGELLLIYGSGDHGLGPKEEEVKAAEGLVKNLPRELMPLRVNEIRHLRAIDYLDAMRKKYYESFPKYTGELYLQFHRGTYSTQVKVKELVKGCERLLEALEKLLTLRYLSKGEKYERFKIELLWREALTAHFHDVLAGSLSKTPYTEFLNKLNRLKDLTKANIRDLISEILDASTYESIDKAQLALFNPLPRSVHAYVKTHEGNLIRIKASPLSISLAKPERINDRVEVSTENRYIVLRNKFLEVKVSKITGEIKSIKFKNANEELLSGRGMGFEIYDDTPLVGRATAGTLEKIVDYIFDSWELYYLQKIDGVKYWRLIKPVEVKIIENNPIRASVLVKYRFVKDSESSIIKHYIRVYADEPWIEGVVEVDWKLTHKLLKLVADLNIWAENVIVGQPYGYVVRRNPGSPYSTLYDRAKWEAWFNNWLDYSNNKLGLALVCGTRFGYNVMGKTLRLTLLRSPKFPPERASGIQWTPELLKKQDIVERGHYVVTYYLYPHTGDWIRGRVPTIAEELLNKPYTVPVGNPKVTSIAPITVKANGLEIPALKLCEDQDNCIILRVFNPYKRENAIEVNLKDASLVRVVETNMLEEKELKRIPASKYGFSLKVDPLKIITLKLIIKRQDGKS